MKESEQLLERRCNYSLSLGLNAALLSAEPIPKVRVDIIFDRVGRNRLLNSVQTRDFYSYNASSFTDLSICVEEEHNLWGRDCVFFCLFSDIVV